MAKEWWYAPISRVSTCYFRSTSWCPSTRAKSSTCTVDCASIITSVGILVVLTVVLFSSVLPGQFLLEHSRLLEAAEMAKKAARLDSGEFDVVFSAAHMLRWVFGWNDFSLFDAFCIPCTVLFCENEIGGPQFSKAEKKEAMYKREVYHLRGLSRGLLFSLASLIYSTFLLTVFCNPLLSVRRQPRSCWFVLACCTATFLHVSLLLFYSLLAPTWMFVSKSVQGSADEPEWQSFSSLQAVVLLNTSQAWKCVNAAMCQQYAAALPAYSKPTKMSQCRDLLIKLIMCITGCYNHAGGCFW